MLQVAVLSPLCARIRILMQLAKCQDGADELHQSFD